MWFCWQSACLAWRRPPIWFLSTEYRWEWWPKLVIPARRRQRQKEQKSKVILGYKVSVRPARTTWNLPQKQSKIKQKQLLEHYLMDECWLMIADCWTSLGIHLFRFLSLLEEMSTIWSFLGFLFIHVQSFIHGCLAYLPIILFTSVQILSFAFFSLVLSLLLQSLYSFLCCCGISKIIIIFYLKIFIFLHICVFCLGAYLYIACVHGPWGDQNSVGSWRRTIVGGCGTPCGCWALDSGPL